MKKSSSAKQRPRSEPFTGWLQHDKVIISEDFDKAQSLYSRGCFGSVVGRRLELSLYEALYLFEQGKILINDKRPLSMTGFIRKAKRINPRFWILYKVYSDIRSRGYIVKAALKFGADFNVYDKGVRPSAAHSKWLLFCVSDSESFSWREFSAMNRVAHSVKKELLVGVVDAEGDVTYYSVNWVRP